MVAEEGWVVVEDAIEKGCGSASELESALKNASANKSVDASVVREAVLPRRASECRAES